MNQTVQSLIDELMKIADKSKKVFVWEGYNAGCQTQQFEVHIDEEGDVLLE